MESWEKFWGEESEPCIDFRSSLNEPAIRKKVIFLVLFEFDEFLTR